MCVLCFEIMVFEILIIHATIANLYCVSVENFAQFVVIGKVYVSTRLRKLRAMFVLMFLHAIRGGLNQMILRCLFLRDCCVTDKLGTYMKPHLKHCISHCIMSNFPAE